MAESKTYAYVVKEIMMGDCEDPELYAAMPMYEWERTEAGQWLKEHAIQVMTYWIRPHEWGYKIVIKAELSERDYIFYKLKYE
jgi:hypothetical protein